MPKTLEARLKLEVAAERLEFDATQMQAAIRLDRLRASLLASSRSAGERLRALAPWLPAPKREPLRGLYLWGGVGRGKTMLMDWFYESLKFSRRERSHFYRFMRRVHAELRTVTDRTQPLRRWRNDWRAVRGSF